MKRLYSRNDPMLARFRGPPRHIRIEPAIHWGEVLVCALVAFGLGVGLAVL